MSSTARPRFLLKQTSWTRSALAAVRLSADAKPPSKLAWRGGGAGSGGARGGIVGGREAAVEAGLAGRAAVERVLAHEHRHGPRGVGRIALGDGAVEDETGGSAREEDLVTV